MEEPMSIYEKEQAAIIETIELINRGEIDKEQMLSTIKMLLSRMEFTQKKKINTEYVLETYFPKSLDIPTSL
jgi:transposase